jgi:LPXTG-motif cell wall-anchored protein
MFENMLLIHQFPYVGLFLLLILGTLGFPFPEDGILILAGILTAHSVIKILHAFLVIYPGLLITDFLLYSFGRKYGRKIIEHKKFQRMISPEQFIKLEEKFKKWGALVVFFGRHLFGVRAQIFLVAGVMRMSLKMFLIVDAASALITITLWGGLGYVGGNHIQTIRKNIANIEQLILAILGILLGSTLLFWYLKKRKNRLRRASLQGPS